MSTQKITNLTLKEAKTILGEFSCTQIKTVESEVEKKRLCDSLLLITSFSESENLGICADNSAQGFAALESYLKALGYKFPFDPASIPSIESPIYIKFNTRRMSHYLDSYTGESRGVLVSCQSEDDTIVGTYGYFPLDLFMSSEE